MSNTPAFNRETAKPVAAYTHTGKRRTVGFHQPDADKTRTHLFSATGDFIVTESTADADKFAAKAEADTKKANAEEIERAQKEAAAAAKRNAPKAEAKTS